MALQPGNPLNGSPSAYQSGSVPPAQGFTRTLALDNLLRRELKVSDPSDAGQIAQALLTRYRDDPRAQAITQEARGLPFLNVPQAPALVARADGSSASELKQAIDDVDRDLQELTTNSLLKDVTPELQGWAQAVRTAIAEGTAAARFALDPRQRDKAFAIRRQLGDYARTARLVGALTPTLSLTYRRFAQSLDEVGAVLLVMMGEALANIGFSGGRFLLQVPFSELQVRRDAAIYALRNLVGATQEAYGPNDWPRGLDAYRSLFELLEQQGHGDLRSLLMETELARIMDELIQRASNGGAEGLRALGATAQLDLERFRRLIIIAHHVVDPESPPLTAFLEALQLFADAFEAAGGIRLLRVARPPILFYGLYGMAAMDDADGHLLNLIIARGRFADELDCFLQCGCTDGAVKNQIVLDKILYDIDRAIDLYAVGTAEKFGDPELRAAAYGFVISVILTQMAQMDTNTWNYLNLNTEMRRRLLEILGIVQHALTPLFSNINDGLGIVNSELLSDYASKVKVFLNDNSLCNIAGTSINLCTKFDNLLASKRKLEQIGQPTFHIDVRVYICLGQALALVMTNPNPSLQITPPSWLNDLPLVMNQLQLLDPFLRQVQQELTMQRDSEVRWRNLVRTMAPNCYGQDSVFRMIENVIGEALDLVGGEAQRFRVDLPPHIETSLDAIANDVSRTGLGRRSQP